MGSLFNNCFERVEKECPGKVKLVSALGKLNYFKAMDQCDFMLGNTSSGIIEAASYGKYAINVGDRQKGRLRNENVVDVRFDSDEILIATKQAAERNKFGGENKYIMAETSDSMIKIITNYEGL